MCFFIFIICMFTYVCVNVCACMCGGQSLSFTLRQGLLFVDVMLASLWACELLGILLPPPSIWPQEHKCLLECLALCGFLGSEFRSLYFHNECLIHRLISSASQYLFIILKSHPLVTENLILNITS